MEFRVSRNSNILAGPSSASPNHSLHGNETPEDSFVPWYQDPQASHPFCLAVKCRAPQSSSPAFIGVEFFPWGETPFERLWEGEAGTLGVPSSRWQEMRSKWRDTAAVCGGSIIRLVNTSFQRQGAPILQVSLPANVMHVKWALNPRNLHPLIIYVYSSIVHVFDAEARSSLGCMRGHGADITSLSVHGTQPHIVCTTSRDFTARIYDLRAVSRPSKSSRIGCHSPFGNAVSDGDCRIGNCVMILNGGRSGGHEAAVLGADFHPSLPLIVTCGMDHAIRIWHLKPGLFVRRGHSFEQNRPLYREDKPLFSSSLIHEARVLSVCWLSHDVLVSQSASQTHVGGNSGGTSPGTLIVWRWLSTGRFFPSEAPIFREPPLRGCISDYRESSSYKILSQSRLPNDASRMSVYCSLRGPPLIFSTVGNQVLFLNASQLPPRNRPILEDDREQDETPTRKRMRQHGATTESAYTDVEGWALNVVLGEDLEDEVLEQCALSPDGRKIAAVGSQEGFWLWTSERCP